MTYKNKEVTKAVDKMTKESFMRELSELAILSLSEEQLDKKQQTKEDIDEVRFPKLAAVLNLVK